MWINIQLSVYYVYDFDRNIDNQASIYAMATLSHALALFHSRAMLAISLSLSLSM